MFQMESLYTEGKHLAEDRLIPQKHFQMWGRGSFSLAVLRQRLEPPFHSTQASLRLLVDLDQNHQAAAKSEVHSGSVLDSEAINHNPI